MAGKNQHFVPKFFLKRFSLNGDQKQIRVLALSKGEFISAGAIKKQSSSNNYYGEVDTVLCQLEGDFAELLRKIDARAIDSNTYKKLLRFGTHLELRNPMRMDGFKKFPALAGEELANQIQAGKHDDIGKFMPPEKFRELALAFMAGKRVEMAKAMTAKVIRVADRLSSMINDLKFKILVNKTGNPFLSSDHPAAMYNQFFENNGIANIEGYGNKGVQLFFPINAETIIMFYDPLIYTFATESLEINIVDAADVDQLNFLQIYNCKNCVYGNERFIPEYAKRLVTIAPVPREREEGKMRMNLFGLRLKFIAYTPHAAWLMYGGDVINNQARNPNASFDNIFSDDIP